MQADKFIDPIHGTIFKMLCAEYDGATLGKRFRKKCSIFLKEKV